MYVTNGFKVAHTQHTQLSILGQLKAGFMELLFQLQHCHYSSCPVGGDKQVGLLTERERDLFLWCFLDFFECFLVLE